MAPTRRIHPMDNKVIVVIAVVVLVAAGAAGAFVLTKDKKDKGEAYTIAGALQVYGNADGDYKIDNSDVTIIEDVVGGKKTLADYPYADTNYDGNVTQDDVDLAKKIINKESCTVKVVSTHSVENYVVGVNWPVTSAIATGSANMLLMYSYAHIEDNIHGICYKSSSPPNKALFPKFVNCTQIGTSTTKIDLDKVAAVQKEHKVTCMLLDRTASTLQDEEPKLVGAGIDVVRLNAACVEAKDFQTQLLMIGFLFQKETECREIADWTQKVMDEIATKTSTISDDKKLSVLTANAGKPKAWISGGNSDYKDVMIHAGADYALSDAKLKEISTYASGAYFEEGDSWIYNLDVDKFVAIRTGGWYSGEVNIVDMWEDQYYLLKEMKCYKEGNCYIIPGDAPIVLRVVYTAAMLYPDLFSTEWADGLNKEFMEKFYPVEINLDGKFFFINDKMYKDAKAATA